MTEPKQNIDVTSWFVKLAPALMSFAVQLREYAKDAGNACSMGDCDSMTLGVRCEQCTRRICMGHAYFVIVLPKLVPFCTYCIMERDGDLFAEDDDAAGDAAATSGDPDVVDAEYEER